MVVEKLSKLLLASLLLLINLQPTLTTAIVIGTPVQLDVPNTAFTVQGKASPFALVTVKDGSNIVSTVAADGLGDFSTKVVTTQGLHEVSTYFVDPATRRSVVDVDFISVQPQQNFTITTFLSPTISRSTASPALRGSIVQIRGYTYSNTAVELNVDFGNYTENTNSNAVGYYEFLVDSNNLGNGVHVATVQSTFGLEQSEVSDSVNFEIQEDSGPTTPDIVVSPDQLPPPTTTTPADGATIDDSTVTIRGESVPFAQINIYENTVIIGSTIVDEFGNWTFEYVAKFTPVSLTFEACVDERCSILSRTITLKFGHIDECDVEFTLNEYRFWGLNEGDTVKISLVDQANGDVLGVSWGDGATEEFDDISGEFSMQREFESAGTYTGQVTVSNDDCEKTRYFSTTVRVRKFQPQAYRFLWLVLIIVSMFAVKQFADQDNQRPIHRH